MHRLLLPSIRPLTPSGAVRALPARAGRRSAFAYTSSRPFAHSAAFAKPTSASVVPAAAPVSRTSKAHVFRPGGRRTPNPPTAVSGASSYNPLIQQLASRSSPMLIYQSESKGPYVTGCFVLGSFCVLYSVINGQTILFDPLVEPSYFVKVTFGLVCSAMLGFGAAFFYKTFRIVRSITVIPTVLGNGQRTVNLRLESGNFRSKFVDVPYDAVTTSKRLYVTPERLSAQQELRKIQAAKEAAEKSRQRIMTLPFRQAGYWTVRGFRAMRRTFADDGWIQLRVNGRRARWKVHEKPAWALRNGKHLDDLTKRV